MEKFVIEVVKTTTQTGVFKIRASSEEAAFMIAMKRLSEGEDPEKQHMEDKPWKVVGFNG